MTAFAVDAPSSDERAARAVLYYGPNGGLARARADALMEMWLGSDSAARRERTTTFVGAEATPARLLDAASATPLFGAGENIALRVWSATDRNADAASAFLERSGAAKAVFVAGTLPPRSRLRARFSDSPHGAAIFCPPDDDKAKNALMARALGAYDLDEEAQRWTRNQLGDDRGLNAQALAVFALWLGEPKQAGRVDGERARLGMGDATQASLAALVEAVVSGDTGGCARALARLRESAGAPSATLSALARRAADARERGGWRAGAAHANAAALRETEARARMLPSLAREIAERAGALLAVRSAREKR